MSKSIEDIQDLELIPFIAAFGHDASGFSKEELNAVEIAIENAFLDIDRGQNAFDSEWDCYSSYVCACIENNFNR